jgi:hypothetical protein
MTSEQSLVSNASEETPLVFLEPTLGDGNYYFLEKRNVGDSIPCSVEAESAPVMEHLPAGSKQENFASRPVNVSVFHRCSVAYIFIRIMLLIYTFYICTFQQNHQTTEVSTTKIIPNFKATSTLAPILKNRQSAIKIEPKVFFANERTFLAWMHTSTLLAGASIAITSFAKDNLLNQLYGVILLPVAIAFILYSMYQCKALLSALCSFFI